MTKDIFDHLPTEYFGDFARELQKEGKSKAEVDEALNAEFHRQLRIHGALETAWEIVRKLRHNDLKFVILESVRRILEKEEG